MFSILQLSLRACDNRSPQQCATSIAVITITRDQFAPFFINTPYQTTINRALSVNLTVMSTTAQDNDLVVSENMICNDFHYFLYVYSLV